MRTADAVAPSSLSDCTRPPPSYFLPPPNNSPRWTRTTTTASLLPIVLLLLLLLLPLEEATTIISSSPSSSIAACQSALLIRVPWAGLFRAKGNEASPRHLLVEYSPPRGHPASPFTLVSPSLAQSSSSDLLIPINGTWPSVGYHFRVLSKGDSSNAGNQSTTTIIHHQGIAYSSPGKPVLVSVAATDRTCTLAYSPPAEPYARPSHFSFHLEYFPVDRPSTIFFIRTNSTSVRIKRLRPGTQYRLALFAEFFSVRSLCPLELTFRTKAGAQWPPPAISMGSNNKNGRGGEEKAPMWGGQNVSTPSKTLESKGREMEGEEEMKKKGEEENGKRKEEEKGGEEGDGKEKKKGKEQEVKKMKGKEEETMEDKGHGKKKEEGDSSPGMEEVQREGKKEEGKKMAMESNKEEDEAEGEKANGEEEDQKKRKAKGKQQKAEEGDGTRPKSYGRWGTEEEEEEGGGREDENGQEEEGRPAAVEGGGQSSGNGAIIRVRQLEDRRNMLELSWDLPELLPCDAFLVKHNATTSEEDDGHQNGGKEGGGGGAVRTTIPTAQIPFRMDTVFQVNISCLFENTVSPQWSAQRVVDLHTPNPVHSVRLVRAFTDEFFRSSVLLGLGLPPTSRPADLFRFYQLQIGWALGKKVVGSQSRVFRGEQIHRGEGRVNISGLEPARLYTFSVRNVSRELSGQSSAPIGLRLTTPPIITSTVYAGKIATDSINVNFGESDPEHPFDHYELHFAASSSSSNDDDDGEEGEERGGGNTTTTLGAVRRLAKHDAKSLTFGKLVPGKTYRFSLFTLLHGVRSRPVDALITTYPLKVSSLRPLLCPGSALLFWTVVQSSPGAHRRFRLSYTASAGPNLHKAVSVELNGTIFRHRFSGLDWNTFYTFTIIVIMGPAEAEAESESESVTIGMAGKPRSLPILQRYGSRELLLTFQNDRDVFSDRNGVVSQFAVIVAEQMDGGTPEQAGDVWDLPGWHDVQERAAERAEEGTARGHSQPPAPWDAYRASPADFNPFGRWNSPASTQFLIGAEDCTVDQRRLDEPYCNGPLRAQVDYWVKVRAYSVAGVAMETQWVGVDGVAALSSGDAKRRREEEEKRRRHPCYLYLNGCNNNGGGGGRRFSPWLITITMMMLMVPFLLVTMAQLLHHQLLY